MKDRLKEVVFDAFMVQHYSCELFGETDYDVGRESYVEDCLNIFLTVRGFAVANLVNKTHKSAQVSDRSSHSLRDSLKSVNETKKNV